MRTNFILIPEMVIDEFASRNYGFQMVDKFVESGIIKVESDTVALENQRYGRNKDTLINKTYIESGEYRRKFDNATDNPKVNKALYDCAKTALKHRSGTKIEDMYWIDGQTGNVIIKIADQSNKIIERVEYPEYVKKAIRENDNLITMHTHPHSMPPSISDLNSAYMHNYIMSYVICHDGKVFGYKSGQNVNERLYMMYIK